MPVDKPFTLGPFKDGLNLLSDPTDVSDTQCVEALNFDLDPNGALKSRPPFASGGFPIPLGSAGDAQLIGIYYANDGSVHPIAGDGLSKTYRYDTATQTWTVIATNFSAVAMTQFDGKAWLVAGPGDANPGGYWSPSGGFVEQPEMPQGRSITVYKDRLWIASGIESPSPTSMFYSKLLVEGPLWATSASREVQVSPGDGQAIVALQPYFGMLLVFRNQSIYSYSYATSTAAAVISVVVPGIGLTSPDCIVSYEAYLYFMYDGKAYEFVNSRAQRINQHVPFVAEDQSGVAYPYAVSTFNRRILFSFFDYIYVFNVDLRAWTRWKSDVWGPIGKVLEPIPGTSNIDAIALPSKTQPAGTLRTCPGLKINELLTTDASEPFTCVLQTKNYAFDLPSSYKRMWWWGADTIFRGAVHGEAIPVVQTQSTDWGYLWSGGLTWADLLTSTWDAPVGADPISEVTEYDSAGLGFMRKFVKFRKAMRFRQVYFRVTFTADGTITTSPVYLFTLRARIAVRQTVSKAIT